MSSEPFRTFVLANLPKWHRRLKRLGLGGLSARGQRYVADAKAPLSIVLHGYPSVINPGNPYPFVMAEFLGFNRPLRELLLKLHGRMGRPLNVVDVGASIGNSALLLMSLGEEKIARLDCVEGTEDFFALLTRNTSRFPGVVRHRAMVMRSEGVARSLVHHHPGTAGASGAAMTSATTLDQLLMPLVQKVDLLKIDIDGSDGEALAGAKALLKRDNPAVIFEWHPFLVQEAGNPPFAAFETLQEQGYKTFLFFSNSGEFSHFSSATPSELEAWRSYLVALHPYGDPHFDVIALPSGLKSLELPLTVGG